MTKHAALSLPFLLLPILAAAGCSADETPRDHVPGTWQDLDDDTGELVATVVFDDDGTFSSTPAGDGDVLAGTWEADDGEMRVAFEDDGEPVTMRMSYHADGDVMVAPALIPDGSVDGVVGSWRGESTISDSDGTVTGVETLELADDGGAVRRHSETGEADEEDTGSWREAADGWIAIDAENALGQEESFRLFTVPGRAIGRDPLVRVE